MAKILITGSTGYLCKYVVDIILASTLHEIILTYRQQRGEYRENPRLTFHKANLLFPDTFDPIFEKYNPDYVIHLAAMARVKEGEANPIDAFNANFSATVHILNLCKDHQVKSCLLASSNLAQNAVSTVGISKLLMEQYILKTAENNPITVLYRVPNILDSKGAVTHIFRRLIKENQPITITHPDMSRSFIDGESAARETLYLLEHGENSGVYVSYNEPTKIIDLARQMMTKHQKDLPIKIVGIKPGEKLSEHVFSEDDVVKTAIPYLGKLKDYNFNDDITVNSILKLNNKPGIANDKGIQRLLSMLF